MMTKMEIIKPEEYEELWDNNSETIGKGITEILQALDNDSNIIGVTKLILEAGKPLKIIVHKKVR